MSSDEMDWNEIQVSLSIDSKSISSD